MPRPRRHKYAPGFPHNVVRAMLLAQGKTFKSFAKEFGVREGTVRDVVDGRRPGRRGQSLKIRLRLEALMNKASHAERLPVIAAVHSRSQKRVVIALTERGWGESDLANAVGGTLADVRGAIAGIKRDPQLRSKITSVLSIPVWDDVATRAPTPPTSKAAASRTPSHEPKR